MKNFTTHDNVVAGVFTPAYAVVTEETAITLDFKEEDVFLDFESAKEEAKRRGNCFVMKVQRF